MERERAEYEVHQGYGAPGELCDTPIGRELLMQVVLQLGLQALTDEAVIMLGRAHVARGEDDEAGPDPIPPR